MVFRLTIASTTLTTTMASSSSHHLRRAPYKLLYKSKSGKSSSNQSSKSVKKAVLGKSSKSAAEDPSYSSDHDAVEVNRPSFEPSNLNDEVIFAPLDDLSAMPSAMPVVDYTTNSPTALLGTTPSHYPIASPHVHDIDTAMMEHPSHSPTIHHHNLFTPSVVVVEDDYHVDSSFAPTTTTTLYHDPPVASRAPSFTSQPSDSSPLTNVPSVASFITDDSSVPPVIEGLFGPSTGGDSFTVTPTLPNEDDTGMDWPTFQPSSSASSPLSIITTPPTDNNEAFFSVTVTLSSDETTSILPSSAPTTITSTLPSSDVPTSFQELNLLNPNTQEQQPTNNNNSFQGAASLMVILACAMVIMGTLYGLFTIMKKDEENVLDEYGAQLAGAAAFDADDIGEVVNVEGGGGGGVDSHLQLVTD